MSRLDRAATRVAAADWETAPQPRKHRATGPHAGPDAAWQRAAICLQGAQWGEVAGQRALCARGSASDGVVFHKGGTALAMHARAACQRCAGSSAACGGDNVTAARSRRSRRTSRMTPCGAWAGCRATSTSCRGASRTRWKSSARTPCRPGCGGLRHPRRQLDHGSAELLGNRDRRADHRDHRTLMTRGESPSAPVRPALG